MKKILFTLATLTLAMAIQAQEGTLREGRGKHKHPEITELISDLSSTQKRKLDALTTESKDRVGQLRKQQKAVRDSIEMYMERDGDQSAALYPLFDREADLQRRVSREMYSTKVRVDEVLTPAQRQQLKQSCRRQGKKR